MVIRRLRWLVLAASLIGLGPVLPDQLIVAQQRPTVATPSPPPDGTWTADAVVEPTLIATDKLLGAGQGVVLRDGKVYAFGDVYDARPRVGVIREYDREFRPTGRVVWLRKNGNPTILHPTGLTWDARFGTFLGDTVNRVATIYRINWDQAWEDGNLDQAILGVFRDDVAINGCRPEFVQLQGRRLLATADYGEIRPEIRLLDPERLIVEGRTSGRGVVAYRILAGPWNQALHWVEARGELICVENVIEGRGWRLDTFNLARAVADGRVDGPDVRTSRLTFPPHNELEGFCWDQEGRALFITSSRSDNLVRGQIRTVPPRLTQPDDQ